MAFQKAERKKAKLRLGLCGPSGSGKTYSALLLAQGLGGKIAVIDTENHSAELYADLCDYDVSIITAPYTVEKYLAALKEAEKSGYSVVILDSITHAWAGEGGLLDQQGKIADSSARKNSYTAWRTVTPKHNQFIEAMLTSPCHVIATMRVKQEYVQEKNENGKTVIRKVGLAPVQREGMEYEFTTVLDIDTNHNAKASKDRTRIFGDQIETIKKETGERLIAWLETGMEPEKPKPEMMNTERFNSVVKKIGGIKTKESFDKAAEYIKSIENITTKEQKDFINKSMDLAKTRLPINPDDDLPFPEPPEGESRA